MNTSELSRRQLLVRSALTATTLSLSMSALAAKRAQARVDPPRDAAKDNDTLNVLLGFEYDAVKTYTAGAAIINADTVTPQETRDTVLKVAVHFQDQHKLHAASLRALITANGGTPVADNKEAVIPASFTNPDTTKVILLAADKEKAAAVGYANTLNTISTAAAAKLIAAIGGVESQHFVVLYLLSQNLIAATEKTNSMASLVVPADFVIDVGLADSKNLESFAALDAALAYDVKPT